MILKCLFFSCKNFACSNLVNLIMFLKKCLKLSFVFHLLYMINHILDFRFRAETPKGVIISPRFMQRSVKISISWKIWWHQRLQSWFQRKSSFFKHCCHLCMAWESFVPPLASLRYELSKPCSVDGFRCFRNNGVYTAGFQNSVGFFQRFRYVGKWFSVGIYL